MNNLKQRIIESFRWKKHPRICAEKLNITEKQYVKLKREILQERKKEKKKKIKRNSLQMLRENVRWLSQLI